MAKKVKKKAKKVTKKVDHSAHERCFIMYNGATPMDYTPYKGTVKMEVTCFGLEYGTNVGTRSALANHPCFDEELDRMYPISKPPKGVVFPKPEGLEVL